MWAVRHPLLILLCAAAVYVTPILLNWICLLPGSTNGANRQQSIDTFSAINLGILAVQATLVGLVFPLVVAFVGLLNQGRASFASRLTVYIDSSTAIFVGVSSLTLCVAIAVQLPFAATIGPAKTAFKLLNIGWFAINALTLAHFVLHTISFLHPARRASIMRSYVTNVVWPRELTETVTANRWSNAVHYGYLPAGDDTDPFAAGGAARTWYTSLLDDGEPQVQRRLRKKSSLSDVRFAMIAPIVRAWLEDVRSLNDGQKHDLVIPLDPGYKYVGEQVLVRATYPLSRVSRWGIRASFRFRKANDEKAAISETALILREMIADLMVLIETRHVEEFSELLSEAVDFHLFLYRLAQFHDEDLNYAQLGSGKGLSFRTIGEEWASAYRDLVRRAIERLANEPQFTGRISYVAARIYNHTKGEVTPKAMQPVLWLARFVAFQLMDWAIGEHHAESSMKADAAAHAFKLSQFEEPYARAWREFVGGWERLLQAIASTPDGGERKQRSWEDLKRDSENLANHLDATTRIAARAVWLGDTLATNWSCDLILHWRIQVERTLDTRGIHWGLRSETLTINTLEAEWSDIRESLLSQGGEEIIASKVFASIFNNAWYDHVVVLTSICTHWAMHAEATATATQAAHMLLHGEPHDRGDVGHGVTAFTGVDILASALRITGSGVRFADNSYAGRIDHLLESLGQLGDSPWVSMRIYSSSGGLDFETLTSAQAILIMATTPADRAIGGDLRHLLTRPDDEALRRQERYLNDLLAALDHLDPERAGVLLTALARSNEDLVFEVRHKNARKLVRQALEILTEHRGQAILNAQIDPTRIAAIANAASSQAFARTAFPLHLFGEIVPTNDTLADYTLRMNGVSKGAYTDPPMAQAVINEEEWWQRTMSDRVAAVVWHDVLATAEFEDIDGRTPNEFWSAVRKGSARIREAGQEPILIIDVANQPRWLADWRWARSENGAPKPSDLVISRASNQPDGYEFTMNDTPVYEAQTYNGAAYLIAVSMMHRLRHHDYGNGLSISLHFEADADNPWQGTMNATFQRAVELSKGRAYRIKWDSPTNQNRDTDQCGS